VALDHKNSAAIVDLHADWVDDLRLLREERDLELAFVVFEVIGAEGLSREEDEHECGVGS
jgi:hypothetical protein